MSGFPYWVRRCRVRALHRSVFKRLRLGNPWRRVEHTLPTLPCLQPFQLNKLLTLRTLSEAHAPPQGTMAWPIFYPFKPFWNNAVPI